MATVAVREAKHSFVGREGELATLTEISSGEAARVLYLHGIAGIGKSTLLGAFLERLRATGASVVHLDCRTVEPTERGYLAAAGQVDNIDALMQHLEALPQPVFLVLDHYELFRLMDTWLRRVLVPSLPPGGRLVLAGREPPVAGWFADLGGEFRSLPLGPARRRRRQRAAGAARRPGGGCGAAQPHRARPPAGPHPRRRRRGRASRACAGGRRDRAGHRRADPAVPGGRPRPRGAADAGGGVGRAAGHRAAAGRHAPGGQISTGPSRACSSCRSSTPAARDWWCTRRCASRSTGSSTAPTRCGTASTGAPPGGSSATR